MDAEKRLDEINQTILSLIDKREREDLHPLIQKTLAMIKAEGCEPTIAAEIPKITSELMPLLLSPHSSNEDLRRVASRLMLVVNHLAVEHMNLRTRHDKALLQIVYEPIRKEKYSLRHGAYVVYKDLP